MIEVVPAVLGNVTDRDERGPRPDHAGRLRTSIEDASGQVPVSREDAICAAAEIEQLLAALRIVLSRTDSYISCFYLERCCRRPSENLADWPIGDRSIRFRPNRIWRHWTWGQAREATVGDNQNSMTAGP
jgi:hypothetical protein